MFDLKNRVINRLSFGDLCRKLVLSWLTSVFVGYVRVPVEHRRLSALECLEKTSFGAVILSSVGICIFLCLLGLFVKTEKAERNGIFVVFAVLGAVAVSASPALPFFAACAVFLVCLGIYAIGDGAKINALVRNERFPLGLTVCLGVAFFIFVSVWTVCRVRSFGVPTYDFGIFSQMFYNMKESGLPVTTLERDGALSHFAVHVSPAFYLFLPVYCVFPYPETLQILQAGVMALSVVPLWKICKVRRLSDWVAAILCGVLIFLPSFSGGAGYDLHENCLLTFFILWVFYGIEKRRYATVFVFALLTLTVKEDAAVYVGVLGLWLCVKALLGERKVRKKDLLAGLAMLILSVGWFYAVTAYLSSRGDGVMTYRYSNFMFDGSNSLLAVVKAVIMNPMKALYECVESEKLKYIGLTLLPLAGIPLFTREYERYILLIPYLLVNLMSDYRYQHDIFFQYSFGSTAFLMYLTAVNLSEFRTVKRQAAVSLSALVIALGCFAGFVGPKAALYIGRTAEKREYYQSIRESLSCVPKDASVAATTFFTTALSSRDIIYDVGHCTKEHLLSVEYVVVNPTDEEALGKYVSGDLTFDELMGENGYEMVLTLDNAVVIYSKTE